MFRLPFCKTLQPGLQFAQRDPTLTTEQISRLPVLGLERL